MYLINTLITGLVLSAGLISGMANATTTNFSGNIFIPPCVINGGNPVTVDWGKQDVTAVPLNSGALPVNKVIPMVCAYTSTDAGAHSANVTWKGTSVPSKPNLLQTTNFATSGVYIQMRYPKSNWDVKLNSTVALPDADITGKAPNLELNMQFLLGRTLSVEKAVGKFSASASLEVAYK